MARVRRGKKRVENRRTHARLFDGSSSAALLDSDAGMQVAAEAVTCRTHDPVWARR